MSKQLLPGLRTVWWATSIMPEEGENSHLLKPKLSLSCASRGPPCPCSKDTRDVSPGYHGNRKHPLLRDQITWNRDSNLWNSCLVTNWSECVWNGVHFQTPSFSLSKQGSARRIPRICWGLIYKCQGQRRKRQRKSMEPWMRQKLK